MDKLPACMILCGGLGSRLRDVTELLPKPMVPIGMQPIVWHIMKTYATYGVKKFILCLGYKREAFVDYFLNYHERSTDITIQLGKNKGVTYHSSHGEEDWGRNSCLYRYRYNDWWQSFSSFKVFK